MSDGTNQLKLPTLDVDEMILRYKLPPLYRSILTFSAILSCHVIFATPPRATLFPPLGLVILTNGVVSVTAITP